MAQNGVLVTANIHPDIEAETECRIANCQLPTANCQLPTDH
jgi:hypothetical protein